MLLTRGKETVERQCIFADMRVDQQSDLRMEFAKSGKCGKRNGHEVANTADIENNLIGTLIEEAAAEQSDHRMKVLLVLGRSVNDRGGGAPFHGIKCRGKMASSVSHHRGFTAYFCPLPP